MRRLAAGIVALVGLWFVVSSIAALPSMIGLATVGDMSIVYILFAAVLPGVIAVGIGAFLIVKRQRLAERWFADEPLSGAIDASSLLRVGLILIGVWAVTWGIVGLTQSLGLMLVPASVDALFAKHDALRDQLPYLIGHVVQVAIGIGLLQGSGRLADSLLDVRRPQSPGTDPDPAVARRCPECDTPFDPADYLGALYPAKCEGCGALLEIPGAEQGVRADS